MSKKRDFDVLQKRRMRAANLLRHGWTQAQVASKLGVSRQSVSRWVATIEDRGAAGLRKAGRAGRRPGLDAAQRRQLVASLKAGALAAGYGTDLWTLKRVGRLIAEQTGVRYSESGVWHVLATLEFRTKAGMNHSGLFVGEDNLPLVTCARPVFSRRRPKWW